MNPCCLSCSEIPLISTKSNWIPSNRRPVAEGKDLHPRWTAPRMANEEILGIRSGLDGGCNYQKHMDLIVTE